MLVSLIRIDPQFPEPSGESLGSFSFVVGPFSLVVGPFSLVVGLPLRFVQCLLNPLNASLGLHKAPEGIAIGTENREVV